VNCVHDVEAVLVNKRRLLLSWRVS